MESSKKIHYRYCAVCKKKYGKGSGSLFQVPLDITEREEWCKIFGVQFAKSAIVCSEHFRNTRIRTIGQKAYLLINTGPINELVQEGVKHIYQPPEKSNAKEIKKNSNKLISAGEQLNKISIQPIKNNNNSIEQRQTFSENHDKASKTSVNFIPPQLEEPVVQMPAIKKVFCAGLTQTNVRLCGLVEASDTADEFRFNCFYCNYVFPLDEWKNFVNHLNEKHSQEEEAFKTSKYLSKEHDYTPISLPPTYPVKTEPLNFDVEPINSSLVDPLGSVQNAFESVVFKSNLSYTPYRSELSSTKKQTKNSFVRFRQKSKYSFKKGAQCRKVSSRRFYSKLSRKCSSHKTALSRCLKRSIKAELKPSNEFSQDNWFSSSEHNETHEADSNVSATEIAFDYTPLPVIDLLLDSMKMLSVLWQFDKQPFNQSFFEAAEDLCNTINNKFSLKIDNFKMRRSINRILRFYCSMYPNDPANNDPLTYYYDKCATFLPPASEIAYARCSHCYACFANDFDLKLHLDKEQKYLEWPYKCPQCKECFRLFHEFELHKNLPHYAETFRCQPCELSFFQRSAYKKHMLEDHLSTKEAKEFKCTLCDKVFLSNEGLRWHKKTHGTKTHKCCMCPKSFQDRSKLEVHLKIHRQQYDFMCEVCGKKFVRQPALNIHMAKHTGEKVTCKICNLRLRKSSLSRHLKLVHVAHVGPLDTNIFSGKITSLGKLLNSTRPRPSFKRKAASERQYKCKICKVTFDNFKLTVEHNRELHSDCPKFSCKLCTSEFRSKLNLKSHYRKKHKWHPFQIFKFIEENASLEEVLSLDLKSIGEIYEDLKQLKYNLQNKKSSDNKSPTNTDFLPDEIYLTDENISISSLQDEIIKVDVEVVGVETQDYMNDMLTEFLDEK